MIIESSRIEQESTHYLKVEHEEIAYRRESEVPANLNAFQVSITGEARFMAKSHISSALSLVKNNAGEITMGDLATTEETTPASRDRAKLDVLLKTLEKITGKKFHFSEIGFTLHEKSESDTATPHQIAGNEQARPENRMRLTETYTERTHYEHEHTGVAISGAVKTVDGREISLDVNLSMSRDYYEEQTEYSLTIAPLTDPLVINYDGNAADLTEEKYVFDLNADGAGEEISFVTPGSGGFLAIDRNQDGMVNDGSELFGATSGNGFTELAVYDEDRNGWIDAGDSVYYDLSVWEKGDDGEDRLIALADTGIGAIYLDATSSPFRVTDSNNQTLGQVRATSIYLMEDGNTGTIQQIDLAT